MKVKKVLKIILLIIAILVLFFLIHTIRNYVIIRDLQKKISQYSDSTNYHIKSVTYGNNEAEIKFDYYQKDNKQAFFNEKNLNGEVGKVLLYNNGERKDVFSESADSTKLVELDCDALMMTVYIRNNLETENNIETFLGSMFATIKSTKYNNKKCYVVKNFLSSLATSFDGQYIYVDKETGLAFKLISPEGRINEKEYEFNNVDDSVFIEPDIGKYTLVEKK